MKFSDSAYYSSKHRLYHNNGHLMGTRLDIILHGVAEEEGEHAFGLAAGEIRRIEKLLSRFDEASPTSTINRLGNQQSIIAEKELFGILCICREYYESTSGLFDIGLGKIITEIKEDKTDGERINNMLEQSGFKNIHLDEEKQSVKFTGQHVELDFGGFGKGYALDRIKTIFIDAGISNSFISFGDSSILAMGNHPHGKGWKSGISNHFNSDDSLFAFTLINESLSTSGTRHILNPVKGLVDQNFRHVSVVSENPVESEVLSTALIAADEDDQAELTGRFKGCRVFEVRYDEDGKPQTDRYQRKQTSN